MYLLKQPQVFSLNQLVFGKNPNFPSVLTDKLPALEGKTSSEIIANHLNEMHAACKAFIEAEASDKLRRAIKAKTRVSTRIIYQPGDLVYYKRNDSNQWKGPGTVLGCENKQILVKQGGVYIRVDASCLQHAQNSQMTSMKENIESANSGNVENKNERLDIYSDSDIEINNEIDQVNNVPEIDENDQCNAHLVAQKSNQAITVASINLPKANDNIEYLNPDSNNLEKALIIGREGKAIGQNKFWFNIKNIETGNLSSIDFSKIKNWKYLEEEVLVNNTSDSADIQILDAKMKEIETGKLIKLFKK